MTQSTVRMGIRGDTECGVMKLKKENTFFPPNGSYCTILLR